MVEFAIASALFIFLLMGILEIGVGVWYKNTVAADARIGARYAIVHGNRYVGHVASPDSVRIYVRARSSLDTIRVRTTWPDTKDPGKLVYVSVVHDTPRNGLFIRAHKDSVTSKMVIAY
jgi:Flp pilus assembly protein TadG